MESNVKLGRVFGIEIGLHYSWFIIALLIVLSVGQRFQVRETEWGVVVVWGTAVVTGLLFFGTLLLHELSHALVARARGLPVGAITLFALGGVSRIEKDPEDPRTEFWIGIAGPLTSLLIGIACLAAAAITGWRMSVDPVGPLPALLAWLGYINVGLALFNLIPGYPLDGGRVLRALVWGVTKDQRRATRLAAGSGQFVAFVFIGMGVLQFFRGAAFGGLWLAFIGWFLLSAAGAARGRAEVRELLRGLHAREVMTRDCAVVESRSSVEQLIDEQLLRTARRCVLVVDGGEVTGLVTLAELKAVPRRRWAETPVGEVMRPLAQVKVVSPETPVSECLSAMAQQDVHQLPVITDDRLVGVITRADILRVIQSRVQLGT